jgi:hypothetical protein
MKKFFQASETFSPLLPTIITKGDNKSRVRSAPEEKNKKISGK